MCVKKHNHCPLQLFRFLFFAGHYSLHFLNFFFRILLHSVQTSVTTFVKERHQVLLNKVRLAHYISFAIEYLICLSVIYIYIQ